MNLIRCEFYSLQYLRLHEGPATDSLQEGTLP